MFKGIFNILKTVIFSGRVYSMVSWSSEILKNSQNFFINDINLSFEVMYFDISFWFNKSDIFIVICSLVIDDMRLLSKFSGAI